MKLLNVLGIVVALHVLAYLVIMSPGCRSTTARSDPAATAPVPGPAGPALAAGPAPQADFAPVSAEPQPIALGGPLAPAPAGDRFAPTRPGAEPVGGVVPAKTYTVQKGDSLAVIARRHGSTTREIAAANNLAASATLHIGQNLVIPGKATKGPAEAGWVAPTTEAADGSTYSVKSGDTLSKIAVRHGTTATALRALNGISGDMLKIGQKLKIPGKAGPVTGAPAILPPPPVQPAGAASFGTPAGTTSGTHTVALGETAESIARKYKISVIQLAKANNLTDPRKLRANQVLTIPGSAGAAAAPPPPTFVPETSALPLAPVAAPPADSSLPPAGDDAPVIKVEDAPAVPMTK